MQDDGGGASVKRPLRGPWFAAGELGRYFLALPYRRARIRLTVQTVCSQSALLKGDGGKSAKWIFVAR
jgi:hypothetical protein